MMSLKRVTVITAIAACVTVLGSVLFAMSSILTAKNQIYVIENGAAIRASASDGKAEKGLEVKDHITRFHELLFNLAPSAESITRNVDRALLMSDRSAYDYWRDLSERGFYQRIISANISQEIVVDSIHVDTQAYPYEAKTYGKLYLLRESNITSYQFESSCRLVDVERSDSNPHGLMIEKFLVTRNETIGTKKRK